MKFLLRLIPLVAVSLVIACGNVTPTPESQAVGALSGHLDTKHGAAFLPPIGPAVATNAFFGGATVTFEIHAAGGGGQLIPAFSTEDGSIRVEDGFYMAVWDVRRTIVEMDPSVERVEVLAFATDLDEDSALAQACALAEEDPCQVGSFVAHLRAQAGGRKSIEPGVFDLTRTRSLPIKLFIAGAFRPSSLGVLTPLAISSFEDPPGNCTINEFTMPGQGLNTLGAGLNTLGAGLNTLGAGLNSIGSVGGLFLFQPDSVASESGGWRLAAPSEAGIVAKNLALDGQLGYQQSAAILVVDDFANGIFVLDSDLLAPSAGLDVEGLATIVSGDGFSHGALVLRQTVLMVEAAGFDTLVAGQDDYMVFGRSDPNPEAQEGALLDHYVVVAAVDTDGLDTDVIPQRIQNALAALNVFSMEVPDFWVDNVAINMSFAIVPCSVLEDFDASGLATFEDYLEELGTDNHVADDFGSELRALVLTPVGLADEPLLEHIERCVCDDYWCDDGESEFVRATGTSLQVEQPIGKFDPFQIMQPMWGSLVLGGTSDEFSSCGAQDVVYVAAAGNFGLDFPMYPAAWPLVVGTSSQDAVVGGFSASKSAFSNSGEVMAPGAIFELGASAAQARVIGYAGTSFAAPVVSLLTALDLMHFVPKCYHDFSNSRLAETGGTSDTPLGDAVAAKCWLPGEEED